MSYTASDIDKIVDGFKIDKPWVFFYNCLKVAPWTQLDGIGQAEFVQEQEEERDYWNEGSIYFVFKVTDPTGAERYFRKTGEYSSYEKAQYYGKLEEVKAAKVQRLVWENLK